MNRPKTVSDAFPTRWLCPEDLRGLNNEPKAFVLKINSVSFEKVRDVFTREEVIKPCVHFEGAKKGMLLNKTQAVTIAKIVGSEKFADWTSREIMIKPGFAKNGKHTIEIYPIPVEEV